MDGINFVIPKLSEEILNGINKKLLDIPYADDSDSQKLDIYYPNIERDGLYPVIVHFHGGAFLFGTKRDDNLEPMLKGLERGYVVVSVEYRKSREARFPALLYDAKAAIRYLKANAEELRLDVDRFAAWGPSAGGWIASMVGVTKGNQSLENLEMGNGEYSSDVNAVIDWCGPCGGFLEMDKALRNSKAGIPDHDSPNSPESLIMGAHIEKIPELVRMANPCTYVNPDTPPFLIVHGSSDQIVPVEQSVTLYNKLTEAGIKDSKLFIYEGGKHHGHPWYHESWISDMCLDYLNTFSK